MKASSIPLLIVAASIVMLAVAIFVSSVRCKCPPVAIPAAPIPQTNTPSMTSTPRTLAALFLTATGIAAQPTATVTASATLPPTNTPPAVSWNPTMEVAAIAPPPSAEFNVKTTYHVVWQDGMNLRQCAGLDCQIVGALPLGYVIDVEEELARDGYVWGRSWADGVAVWVALRDAAGARVFLAVY